VVDLIPNIECKCSHKLNPNPNLVLEFEKWIKNLHEKNMKKIESIETKKIMCIHISKSSC